MAPTLPFSSMAFISKWTVALDPFETDHFRRTWKAHSSCFSFSVWMFSMTVSSTPRDLPSHLHLLPITLATKAWQHWSTCSVSIKNEIFVFNSIVYQVGTCQLHDLVVMKRLLREWEQFWTASSLSCLIERRRLGTECKFSQQAWQVTSHLTLPRTTENKADFSTLYNSLQDFTGKEGTSNK